MSRWTYVIKRLILSVPVLIFGLTITFLVLYLGPFDPVTAMLGQKYNKQDALRIRKELGLVKPNGEPAPLWDQYIDFMLDLFTFKFGQSWVVQSERPVSELIIAKMTPTVWLGVWSVLIALIIGLPLGFYAGLNPNSYGDYLASFGGIVWRAMPNFWLAVMLAGLMSAGGLLAFYTTLGSSLGLKTSVIGTPEVIYDLAWAIDPGKAPIIGPIWEMIPLVRSWWIPMPKLHNVAVATKWILPAALVLGSSSMGNEMRIGRTATLEKINSNYVEMAKAKGVSPRKIITKHVFRNALIPLLPVIMGEFYLLIGGSVLVEGIFQINGLGSLFLQAINRTDIPIIAALAFIFITITLVFNIVQDIAYTIIDPRVGLE